MWPFASLLSQWRPFTGMNKALLARRPNDRHNLGVYSLRQRFRQMATIRSDSPVGLIYIIATNAVGHAWFLSLVRMRSPLLSGPVVWAKFTKPATRG